MKVMIPVECPLCPACNDKDVMVFAPIQQGEARFQCCKCLKKFKAQVEGSIKVTK